MLGAMALSVLLVLLYIVGTKPNPLTGDQFEYHEQGIFFTDGHWWWSSRPFDIPHASPWRAPLYGAWVGFLYTAFGVGPAKVLVAQSLLAAVTVGLSWALARRLFGPRAAIWSAFLVAAFPLVWEWFGLMYTEAFAIPLVTLTLLMFLERPPSTRLSLASGAVIGVSILVRPSAFFVFAGIAAAWVIAAGWRRGLAFTALSVGVAALVVLPWTVRNYVVTDGFVPLSMQDTAIYGTFSETSANDPVSPYSWRPVTEETEDILDGPPIDDDELRSKLQGIAWDYIEEQPFSVVEAFYWNGLSRFWDIRRPARAMDEVSFEGRQEGVTLLGLAMYYVLLPLAIYGLWRHRRRKSLVIPVLATALAASVVFTTASGTRYRAPLEPLIAIIATSAFVPPRPPPRTQEAATSAVEGPAA